MGGMLRIEVRAALAAARILVHVAANQRVPELVYELLCKRSMWFAT